MPPEGYKLLPKGVRCRCLRLWREADQTYWCCNIREREIEQRTNLLRPSETHRKGDADDESASPQ